jgi:hypothetical protein
MGIEQAIIYLKFTATGVVCGFCGSFIRNK